MKPSIDYMAKDYASFRQLMLDRLAATLPGWEERHAPDLGIALIEVLAYATDYLSYYQDAVATEAYLGTARQRISIKRHARLLDYHLHEGCNARVWVQCQVAGGGPATLDLNKVSFVATAGPGVAQVAWLRMNDLQALPQSSYELFKPMLPNPRDRGRGVAVFHPAFNEMGVSPLKAGATEADITLTAAGTRDWKAVLKTLHEGSVLLLCQNTGGGKPGIIQHQVCLSGTPELVRHDQGTAIVHIAWHADDAIPEYVKGCVQLRALGNIVLADHGRETTVVAGLAAWQGSAGPLPQQGLTFHAPLAAGACSAAAMAAQDPRDAVPAIALRTNGEQWKAKRDLFNSFSADRHFCAELDDSGRAWIRFGDGEGVGERPPDETKFDATYRIGNGEAGNVAPHAIKLILPDEGYSSPDLDRISVTNPFAAFGGTSPESINAARLLAPGDMRVHQRRAIAVKDYVDFARSVGGISDATASIVQEGARRIVRLAIVPAITDVNQSVQERLKTLRPRVYERLEPLRRINHEVTIVGPVLVPLYLKVQVALQPSYLSGTIKEQVTRQLIGSDDGTAEQPLLDSRKMEFGRTIHWSEVVSRIHAIPGVAGVTQVEFRRLNAPAQDPGVTVDAVKLAPEEIAVLIRKNLVVDTGKAEETPR